MTCEKPGLLDPIVALPVWDTHTHLTCRSLAARDVWEILHYFWFLRELCAAGYPADHDALPEPERIRAFLKAFNETRNTAMNQVVRHIFERLYDVTITDERSVMHADERVRESAADPSWADTVCKKLNISKIVTNNENDIDSRHYPNRLVPRLEKTISGWMERITTAADPSAEGEAVAEEIYNTLGACSRAGCKGIMTSNSPFGRLGRNTAEPIGPGKARNSKDEVSAYILHVLCRAAEANNLFVQLFLGVESGWGPAGVPANDPDRILNLYGLFNRYDCQFEIVLASSLNNLEAVQAARIFPNVHVGAMWWYNFRPSTYRDTMQYRIEALPPKKCSLIASDARCIEWCYGKVFLVKRLLAGFLSRQVEAGWLDNDEAVRVARGWLHDAAASLFGEQG